MLINLSNHPSANWSAKQLSAAQEFGSVVDLAFPEVDQHADENYIANLAKQYLGKVKYLSQNDSVTVHIMGEMTFTFALVSLLKSNGIICIASTTERIVNEFGNGQKQTTFRFVRFRKYIL